MRSKIIADDIPKSLPFTYTQSDLDRLWEAFRCEGKAYQLGKSQSTYDLEYLSIILWRPLFNKCDPALIPSLFRLYRPINGQDVCILIQRCSPNDIIELTKAILSKNPDHFKNGDCGPSHQAMLYSRCPKDKLFELCTIVRPDEIGTVLIPCAPEHVEPLIKMYFEDIKGITVDEAERLYLWCGSEKNEILRKIIPSHITQSIIQKHENQKTAFAKYAFEALSKWPQSPHAVIDKEATGHNVDVIMDISGSNIAYGPSYVEDTPAESHTDFYYEANDIEQARLLLSKCRRADRSDIIARLSISNPTLYYILRELFQD